MKMINKLLCFMWGHVPEEIARYVIVEFSDGKKSKIQVCVRKCIR